MSSNKTKATLKGQLQQRKTTHSTGENNHVTGKIGFCLAADSPLSLVPNVKCEVMQYGALCTGFATVFYPICCDLFTCSLLSFGFMLQLVTKALNMET